ncbi:MAG: aldehyde reductase [Pseudomonadota bacterium]
MAKTVLLTGVTGFIAKRIALDLLNAGHAVRGSLRSERRADEVRAALRPALDDPNSLDRLSFVELDLARDEGWAEAMDGIDAVLHTASPFPMVQPKDENEIIKPAVDGALRALRAAETAGVTRVVMTSSLVAIMSTDKPENAAYSEADWTDTSHPTATAYVKSKTLAEKAAWDFVSDHPAIQLTTINPGLVAGRPMDRNFGTSLQVIERILGGKDPMLPDVGFPVVDVKDVSAMHLKALDDPNTVGKRFIASAGFATFPEIADVLRGAFPTRKIAKSVAPKIVLRILSLFDPSIRTILPTVGLRLTIDNALARDEMGMDFVPWKESVLESARFLEASES